MADRNEGILAYTCMETGRGVATGIATDAVTLTRLARFQISVWCPHCETSHVITGKEAMLVPVGAPQPSRPDWPASVRA
jgi:hypothetical protein